ncbi:ABC transporter ATP-binding protein [Oceanidesulfovibrio marinus]|uniref:ABC transporter ATP-binding protein n=1 Tax=Oceanidesulfovibrio marinus TaxID=370038 RepID=A0A6P1ZB28_9BACT|nr:oligopeptide/dipeptide ABC transporter ATP-binding protein [Oceanidesulfovibrio marinus]QJT09667.1 ATP-binding cassette domain-containing protein [Oceanidesulfovibrio marinus]TVM31028.1 ABC transporter ATP-binding protein [Oceanidesulfovibrio marinus]
MSTPIVSLKGVSKRFDISGGLLDQLAFKGGRVIRTRTEVKAVNNVSFDIQEGETLSVVGESGCGKSTLARTVIGLFPPTFGEIYYRGERIDHLSPSKMLPYRTRMQMVFQDPYASLNPRMKVKEILEEPVLFHGSRNGSISRVEVEERVAAVMEQVGIDPAWASNYPHEFSGGQRQRISLARALVVDPEFIIADEPISALDVSIQAQILNLMLDLQEERGLTYLFISHDLSVVEHISSRVAVMYLGTLCELAKASAIFQRPRHPYTRALLSAIPTLGGSPRGHVKLEGDVPTPIRLPSGCVFHGRCPYANARCMEEVPMAIEQDDGALVACHGVEEGRIPEDSPI